MNSEEFLEMIKKEQMKKELDIIGKKQINNLRRIKEIARESLEELGSIYDEIKTKEIRSFLEKEMNGLGQIVLELEGKIEVLDVIIKGKEQGESEEV